MINGFRLRRLRRTHPAGFASGSGASASSAQSAVSAYSKMLQWSYKDAQLLLFSDGDAAWMELSQTAPDLLITDIRHKGLQCEEMLALLAKRNVRFPILIISAFQTVDWRGWGPGLNVSFLSKPASLEGLRTAVETALNVPARRTANKGNQPLGKCPKCGSGVVETKAGYACKRSNDQANPCKFRIGRTVLQQPIEALQIQKLLTTGKTDLLDGFISKAGGQFPAYLVINGGKITFEFPPREQES